MGVIIRQGILSPSAIFAKALPEKPCKQRLSQHSLSFRGDFRVDYVRIRQSLLFLQVLPSQISRRFSWGQDSQLRAEDLVLLECFLFGRECFCWSSPHVCRAVLQDVICGRFLLQKRFCPSRPGPTHVTAAKVNAKSISYKMGWCAQTWPFRQVTGGQHCPYFSSWLLSRSGSPAALVLNLAWQHLQRGLGCLWKLRTMG